MQRRTRRRKRRIRRMKRRARPKRRKKRPLFTKYSLSTLESNSRFSHDKATLELGYYPRDVSDSVRDMVAYLEERKEEKREPFAIAGKNAA